MLLNPVQYIGLCPCMKIQWDPITALQKCADDTPHSLLPQSRAVMEEAFIDIALCALNANINLTWWDLPSGCYSSHLDAALTNRRSWSKAVKQASKSSHVLPFSPIHGQYSDRVGVDHGTCWKEYFSIAATLQVWSSKRADYKFSPGRLSTHCNASESWQKHLAWSTTVLLQNERKSPVMQGWIFPIISDVGKGLVWRLWVQKCLHIQALLL